MRIFAVMHRNAPRECRKLTDIDCVRRDHAIDVGFIKKNNIFFTCRFPQDLHSKEKWIKIIQVDQSDEEWLPTKYSRICSAHFDENYLYMTPLGRRKLKLNAIPAFRPPTELPKDLPADHNIPSSPLHDAHVSDTDSIFDSPRKINLKKQLRIEKSKREKCRKKIIKLKKQNKYLKTKIISLREVVKSLKKKKFLNKEDFNGLDLNAKEANKELRLAFTR